MRRLSVVLLIAAYSANEAASYRTRESRDLSDDQSVENPISRVTREINPEAPKDLEMMDTQETHIFPPAFAMIENERRRQQHRRQTYLLVDVASVNNVPVAINAQYVPYSYYGLGGFYGGFRR